MTKVLKIIMILVLMLAMIGCFGNNENEKKEDSILLSKLELSADQIEIMPDGVDNAIFSVKAYDENNNEVFPKKVELYKNGELYNEMSFKTNVAGNYKFFAKVGEVKSNEITITNFKKVSFNCSTGGSFIYFGGKLQFADRYIENPKVGDYSIKSEGETTLNLEIGKEYMVTWTSYSQTLVQRVEVKTNVEYINIPKSKNSLKYSVTGDNFKEGS